MKSPTNRRYVVLYHSVHAVYASGSVFKDFECENTIYNESVNNQNYEYILGNIKKNTIKNQIIHIGYQQVIFGDTAMCKLKPLLNLDNFNIKGPYRYNKDFYFSLKGENIYDLIEYNNSKLHLAKMQKFLISSDENWKIANVSLNNENNLKKYFETGEIDDLCKELKVISNSLHTVWPSFLSLKSDPGVLFFWDGLPIIEKNAFFDITTKGQMKLWERPFREIEIGILDQ